MAGGAREPLPGHFSRRDQQWDSPLCPRCRATDETTFDQLWGCPCNEEVEGTHMDLAVRAAEEWQNAPCFWLRGLPPQRWTAQRCTLPMQGEVRFGGCGLSAPVPTLVGAALATDGSGGLSAVSPGSADAAWASWSSVRQGTQWPRGGGRSRAGGKRSRLPSWQRPRPSYSAQ